MLFRSSIEHDLKTTEAPLWRSAVLSLSSSDELGAQPLLEHSNDLSTCIAGVRQIVDGGHLMRDDIFHYYDGHFLMITSHFDENFLPTPYLDPFGFHFFIGEWYSFGDL